MAKSAEAFRTISEVADWLGVQTHVLRFWESKFSQIKPVKRAGGRRYYRPADMLLIGGIRKLLHDDGLTIKGVQKILREEGNAYVADMSHPLDDETSAVIDGIAETPAPTADVSASPAPEPIAESDQSQTLSREFEKPSSSASFSDLVPSAADGEQSSPAMNLSPESTRSEQEPFEAETDQTEPPAEPVRTEAQESHSISTEDPEETPTFSHTSFRSQEASDPIARDATFGIPAEASQVSNEEETPPAEPRGEDIVSASPRPRITDIPDVPDEASFSANPSLLTRATKARQISQVQRDAIRPLLVQLSALRDQMAETRGD